MKYYGGFFERETCLSKLPTTPRSKILLSSGRVALRAICRQTRPKAIYVPRLICDAALEPIMRENVKIKFYDLEDDLSPRALPQLQAEESFLYVNYWGLCDEIATELIKTYQHQLILDNSQNFFASGNTNYWSFNSVRKFWGVADGSELWGPKIDEVPVNSWPQHEVQTPHLDLRAQHLQAQAYQEFLAYESNLTSEFLRASRQTTDLLPYLDFNCSRESRRKNFAELHKRLGVLNDVSPVILKSQQLAMYYPLKSDQALSRAELASKGIFCPVYWTDACSRLTKDTNVERDIIENWLFLPIDQRYNISDMATIAELVVAQS